MSEQELNPARRPPRWIKGVRHRKTTSAIWSEAAAKLTGHFRYHGVVYNEAKLSHFRWSCVGALYRWLNRRSQKRSYTWEQFQQRLRFHPLPHPPCGRDRALGKDWLVVPQASGKRGGP